MSTICSLLDFTFPVACYIHSMPGVFIQRFLVWSIFQILVYKPQKDWTRKDVASQGLQLTNEMVNKLTAHKMLCTLFIPVFSSDHFWSDLIWSFIMDINTSFCIYAKCIYCPRSFYSHFKLFPFSFIFSSTPSHSHEPAVIISLFDWHLLLVWLWACWLSIWCLWLLLKLFGGVTAYSCC